MPKRRDNKDWTGDLKSITVTSGFSSHTEKEREQDDYYATDPIAVRLLMGLEEFEGTISEVACGGGHLSKEMEAMGYKVISTDLVYRGYGRGGVDFLKQSRPMRGTNIVTNPPYKFANDFIRKSLELIDTGKKVAMFLPIRYVEGKARKKLFEQYPPKRIWVSSSRINCAMNGDFENYKYNSAVCYCWFVWEKGWTGDTTIKWFN